MANDKQEKQGVWVALHLEPQSERSNMPPTVIGYLTGETASSYQLTKVVKMQENEDSYDMEYVEVNEHHHINKTYVWDCEVLGERPIAPPYNGEGGLG